MENYTKLWWVYALRGSLAMLFAALLLYVSQLLGTLFFDPVVMVTLGVLLGFYVLANGVLFSIAAIYGAEHHRDAWRGFAAEAAFAFALGIYIAFYLFISPRSIALLAGLHALGAGGFEGWVAWRMRHDPPALSLLGTSAVVSLTVGAAFLLHSFTPMRLLAMQLSAFECFFGAGLLLLAVRLRRPAISRPMTVPAVA